MSFMSSFESFFEDRSQSLMKGEEHRDRCRVMVRPILSPVTVEERNIEVETLALFLSFGDGVKCPLAERHRRKTRWGGQTLLRSGIGSVNAPSVDFHRK